VLVPGRCIPAMSQNRFLVRTNDEKWNDYFSRFSPGNCPGPPGGTVDTRGRGRGGGPRTWPRRRPALCAAAGNACWADSRLSRGEPCEARLEAAAEAGQRALVGRNLIALHRCAPRGPAVRRELPSEGTRVAGAPASRASEWQAAEGCGVPQGAPRPARMDTLLRGRTLSRGRRPAAPRCSFCRGLPIRPRRGRSGRSRPARSRAGTRCSSRNPCRSPPRRRAPPAPGSSGRPRSRAPSGGTRPRRACRKSAPRPAPPRPRARRRAGPPERPRGRFPGATLQNRTVVSFTDYAAPLDLPPARPGWLDGASDEREAIRRRAPARRPSPRAPLHAPARAERRARAQGVSRARGVRPAGGRRGGAARAAPSE
jgi:hypothetical protein